jgi:hypothetical protein
MPARIGSVESFGRAAKLLEDAFFLAQDAVLVERLQALRKMQESKEAHTAACVELDIRFQYATVVPSERGGRLATSRSRLINRSAK